MTARPVACLLIAFSLSACSADVEPKAPPVNPEPHEAYRLEVWLQDPPRPMTVDSMKAVFQDMDSGCLPHKPGSGALAVDPVVTMPLSVEPLGEGRFAAIAQADGLLQTDLYGQGRCEWKLIGVEVLWNDGVLRYRQFAEVLPTGNEPEPVEGSAVFSRESRGIRRQDGAALVALPITTTNGGDVWPTGEFEDINARRTDSSNGSITAGPYRTVGPETDFRANSLSERADSY